MRLIDADALANNITILCEKNKALIDEWLRNHIEDEITDAPTIEAESIIRCKNCEYYNGEDKYCVNDIFAKPNGYCMYGKEKDE